MREDLRLLANSFASERELFFFLGASTLDEIEARLQPLRDARRRATSAPPRLALPSPPSPPPPPPPPLALAPPKLTLAGLPPLLVFDTETTGLKPAIVCQLAYVVVEDGQTTEVDKFLKLPLGIRISKAAQGIHGISMHTIATFGVDAAEAMDEFLSECRRVLKLGGRVVAHNARFDVRAIRETIAMHRMACTPLTDGDVFCTMIHSKIYSQLVDKAGRKKAFKNDELYKHLFKTCPDWAMLHDALADVKVTLCNYVEGRMKKYW